MNQITGLATIMLYLVGAFLLANNAAGFSKVFNSVGRNWRETLVVLQAR